jgi:hypothetical protein
MCFNIMAIFYHIRWDKGCPRLPVFADIGSPFHRALRLAAMRQCIQDQAFFESSHEAPFVGFQTSSSDRSFHNFDFGGVGA